MDTRFILLTALILVGQVHAQNTITFEDVAQEKSITYAGKTFGSTWGDIDNDGKPDLFLSCHTNGADLYNDNDFPIIYMNNGDSFESNLILAGLDIDFKTINDWHGSVFFDVDRDGDLDMLNSLGGNSDNTFYLNEDGIQMIDFSDEFNLSNPNSSGRTPGLIDINGDGFTDIITNGITSAGGSPKLLINEGGETYTEAPDSYNFNWTTSVFSTTSDLNNDGGLALLSFNGQTRFQQLENGVLSSPVYLGTNRVLDFIVEDLNGDLLPDIFEVKGDRGAFVEQINDNLIRSNVNLFFLLDPVDFEFSSESDEIQLVIYPSKNESYTVVVGDSIYPMETGVVTSLTLSELDPGVVRTAPIEFPDITARIYVFYNPENEKWEVIAKSDVTYKRPLGIEVNGTDLILEDNYPVAANFGGKLYYNQGDYEFEEVQTNVFDENDNLMSVVAADFDNDMDLDLYAVRSNYASNKSNILWENVGEENWVRHEGAWGAEGNGPGIGENVSTVDYNNDGFIDLFVTNGSSIFWLDSARLNLYENQGNSNNWLKVQLKGVASDPLGLQAKVVLTAGGVSQVRYQNGATHRFSQNDTRLHFGLGQNTSITSIEVFWPSGIHQVITDVDINQIITIEEEEPCEAPYPVAENLSSEVLQNGVRLKWDVIPGSFNCQVNGGKAANSATASFLTNEANSSEFWVPAPQLELNTEYRWRVRCACTFNTVGNFTPFQFFTWGGNGSENGIMGQDAGSAHVYPNPVENGYITVNLDFSGAPINVNFTDLQGRLIKELVLNDPDKRTFQFDMSDFDAGVYVLTITNGKEFFIERVAKK